MLQIITHETESKFQLTIGVFSIAFLMSVIQKLTDILNTVTMKYELRYKCWINTVVIILYNDLSPAVWSRTKKYAIKFVSLLIINV